MNVSGNETRSIATRDGRTLSYLEVGDRDGPLVVHNHGGPSSRLEARLFAVSVLCVVDSRTQCAQYGDSSYAIRESWIRPENLIELSTVISNPAIRRRSGAEITIPDLTGVAVQDTAVA